MLSIIKIRFMSLLCHLLALRLWANCLTSLHLKLLICKMTLTVPGIDVLRGLKEIKNIKHVAECLALVSTQENLVHVTLPGLNI